MAESSRFELSRIYAKGWSAAAGCSVDDAEGAVEAEIAKLNPYSTGEEKERWALGFQDAMRRTEKKNIKPKAAKAK